jgi:hypothetical protein
VRVVGIALSGQKLTSPNEILGWQWVTLGEIG